MSRFTATATSPSSATIAATIDQLSATTVVFTITGGDTSDTQTTTQSVPASLVPRTATWNVTNLQPNLSYTASVTTATASTASVDGPRTAFQTPLLPAEPVTLHARHTVLFGGADDDPDFSVSLGIPADELSAVYEAAPAPATTFAKLGDDPLTIFDGTELRSDYSFPPPGFTLDRNTRFRLLLSGASAEFAHRQVRQPSVSPSVLVYVLPRISIVVKPKLTVTPYVPDRYPPQTEIVSQRDFSVQVGIVLPRSLRVRRRVPVFVYDEAPGARVFTRLASMTIGAGARAVDVTAPGLSWQHGLFMVCSRAQFVADLGPTFSYPACGNRTLTAGGPLGAQFTQRMHAGDR